MHGASKCVIGVECVCGMELSRFVMVECVYVVCCCVLLCTCPWDLCMLLEPSVHEPPFKQWPPKTQNSSFKHGCALPYIGSFFKNHSEQVLNCTVRALVQAGI